MPPTRNSLNISTKITLLISIIGAQQKMNLICVTLMVTKLLLGLSIGFHKLSLRIGIVCLQRTRQLFHCRHLSTQVSAPNYKHCTTKLMILLWLLKTTFTYRLSNNSLQSIPELIALFQHKKWMISIGYPTNNHISIQTQTVQFLPLSGKLVKLELCN